MSNLEKITRQRINAPDFAQPKKRTALAELTVGFSSLALIILCVVVALSYLPYRAI